MGESVRESWGRYAAAFAAEGPAAEQRDSIRRLVQLCDIAEGARVLDVGTGAGYAAFVFARTGVEAIGVDPTHEMLMAYRSGWSERGFAGRCLTVESWAEALPFASRSVDAVVSHRAPHQFADAHAYAREAARVLVPGGTFGLADQSPPDGHEDWHNTFERLRDPTHEYARSPATWRGVVEAAGLEVTATDVVYQSHDLEDWMDRVGTPEDARPPVRQMLDDIPAAIAEVYRLPDEGGRRRFRTPQHILVASKP